MLGTGARKGGRGTLIEPRPPREPNRWRGVGFPGSSDVNHGNCGPNMADDSVTLIGGPIWFPPPSQDVFPPGLTVAELFLKTIFGDHYVDAHVTGFLGDPTVRADSGRWGGGRYIHRIATLSPQHNLYVTVSTFGTDAAGREVRTLPTFRRFHALMIDDVGHGQKIDPLNIPDRTVGPHPGDGKTIGLTLGEKATAVVETSPGNYQLWYALGETISAAQATWLQTTVMNSLLSEEHRDPGMLGLNRYGRLPGGVNAKAKVIAANDGKPWPVRLHRLRPLHRFTFKQLCELFRLIPPTEQELAPLPAGEDIELDPDIAEEVAQSWIKAAEAAGLEPGEHRHPNVWSLICPWSPEHTDGRPDRSAAFRIPTGDGAPSWFKCHHGHCSHRTLRDFIAYLKEHSPEAPPLSHKLPPASPMTAVTADDVADLGIEEQIGLLTLLPLKDVPKRPAIPPLIDGVGIPAVGVSLLAGAGGIGKSTLALQIAASVASGEHLFGQYAVGIPGQVLMYAGEDNVQIVADRLGWMEDLRPSPEAMIRMRANIILITPPEEEQSPSTDPDPDKAVRADTRAVLGGGGQFMLLQYSDGRDIIHPSPSWLAFIRAIRSVPDLRLIVLDPKMVVDLSNENDAAGQAGFMATLQKLAHRFRVCVLLIHHTTKAADKAEEREAHMIRGSGAIVNATRHAMLLAPRIFRKGDPALNYRYDLTIVKTSYSQPTTIQLMNPGGTMFMPEPGVASRPGPGGGPVPDLQMIYMTIARLPKGKLPTAAQLARQFGVRRDEMSAALDRLTDIGVLARTARTRYLADDHAEKFVAYQNDIKDLLT